jgi:beta-lactamase class A
MTLARRDFLALPATIAVVGAATVATAARAEGAAPPSALDTFAAIGEGTSCLLEFGPADAPSRWAVRPDEPLFVGSAVKTFILAQFLRDVEAGRLDGKAQLAVDDAVRSLSSPVFLNLTGTTQATSILEAMIAHSDNTATDIALAEVGADRVRALIAEAGLTRTKIPHSTRRMFSWIAGADAGVDLGWDGVERVAAGPMPAQARQPVNDTETMMSTADDLVRWYQAALSGAYFGKPATLTEFRRIQSMADALPVLLPPGIYGTGKGGSIDWAGFHCFCMAGQMIVREEPATFCFTVNWTGADDTVGPTFDRFRAAAVDIVAAAVAVMRG